jgi:hypothetical protein
MEKSEQINEIAKALVQFNAAMGKVVKSTTNPFFKTKYASLPDILDAIAEPLEKSGLVIIQVPDGDSLECCLVHAESGQFICGRAQMKPVKSDPQSIGSAITYQRRYNIASILNLNIDDDDDGNAASLNMSVDDENAARHKVLTCESLDMLEKIWNEYPGFQKSAWFVKIVKSQKPKCK